MRLGDMLGDGGSTDMRSPCPALGPSPRRPRRTSASLRDAALAGVEKILPDEDQAARVRGPLPIAHSPVSRPSRLAPDSRIPAGGEIMGNVHQIKQFSGNEIDDFFQRGG